MTRKTPGRPPSPALVLIQHVAVNAGKAFGAQFYGDRRHHAINSAVRMALTCGLTFDPGDFLLMGEQENGLGFRFCADEYVYSVACGISDTVYGDRTPNRSACIAFERYAGRRPFIYRSNRNKGGRRLAVGSKIMVLNYETGTWTQNVRVTSIADDGESFVACTYKNEDDLREEAARRVVLDSARPMKDSSGKATPRPPVNLNRQTVAKRFIMTRGDLTRQNNMVTQILSPAKKDKELF